MTGLVTIGGSMGRGRLARGGLVAMVGLALGTLGGVFTGAAQGQGEVVGSQGHEAVVIADPSNSESLYVANRYASARRLPPFNVVFVDPSAPDLESLAAVNYPALQGHLERRGLTSMVDYLLLTSDAPFFVEAPGYVIDPCSPLQRFALSNAYGMMPQADVILSAPAEPVQSFFNGFSPPLTSTMVGDALAFDSETRYANGLPSVDGTRAYIAAAIGYTGLRGNSLAKVLETIDRGVASDGTFPTADPVHLIETTDAARSSPRDGEYADVVSVLSGLGQASETFVGDLPSGGVVVSGVMTGLPDPAIPGADFSFVPGAYADHLTSFAGAFDIGVQRKMSSWIGKGATLTSGAVEEPCNYTGKFPSAYLFAYAAQGVTLGEAWQRAHRFAPLQTMLLGDPMSRPWGAPGTVIVNGLPTAPVESGLFFFFPNGTNSDGSLTPTYRVLIDGRVVLAVPSFGVAGIDTTGLDDGWHELRLEGRDTSPAQIPTTFITSFEVNNVGGGVSLSVATGSGTVNDPFSFTIDRTTERDDVREVRLLHRGRVVGSAASVPAVIELQGHIVGAGEPLLTAEIEYDDGAIAKSAPVVLDVAFDEGAAPGSAAVEVRAFDYRFHVGSSDSAFVVPFPSNHGKRPEFASFRLVTPPMRATVVSAEGIGVDAPYVVLTPPAARVVEEETLVFEVDAGNGFLDQGTVTLVYDGVCPADQNGDGTITGTDFTAFIENFSDEDLLLADINDDGIVSGVDFTDFIISFGVGCD